VPVVHRVSRHLVIVKSFVVNPSAHFRILLFACAPVADSKIVPVRFSSRAITLLEQAYRNSAVEVGAAPFTLEASVKLEALPTGAPMAVVSKWGGFG
jgi:hypothetical protein